MNAFRPSIARTATRFQRRTVATARPGFKETWLSDPSTYPIIGVMGFGLTFMTGMIFNALFTYKQGVDISPDKRGAIMKPYSSEYRAGIVEKFVGGEGVISAEGRGVNAEEWKKQKEAYYKE